LKNILQKAFIIIIISAFIFSCKRRNASPADANVKCPLMEVNGPKGNIRNYEWVGAKLVRVFSKDSIPTTMIFRYNNKNLAESMEIIPEGSNEKYLVRFQYGDKNLIVKSFVSINGIQFMTNDFSYNENQDLSSINTQVNLFGRKTSGKTRLVYENNNVSKVYSAIDNDLEVLAFSGEEYDDKIQFFPEVYKTAALGFVGIANNFFSYFGKNNMIKGKIYDANGRVDQETQIDYLYARNGLPLQSETISLVRGKRKTEICSYNFGCK
jgi:hypothetical protein